MSEPAEKPSLHYQQDRSYLVCTSALLQRKLPQMPHTGRMPTVACYSSYRQLREEVDPPPTIRPSPVTKRRRTDDPDTRLAACMSAKLEVDDFKDAVRLASSEDMLAPMN